MPRKQCLPPSYDPVQLLPFTRTVRRGRQLQDGHHDGQVSDDDDDDDDNDGDGGDDNDDKYDGDDDNNNDDGDGTGRWTSCIDMPGVSCS